MLKMIDELRTGHSLLRLIQDPQRTEEIFKISEITLKRAEKSGDRAGHGELALGKEIIDRAMSHEGFRALYERRYFAPKVDLNALGQLAPDTLGHAYARHLNRNGLSPDFFPRFEANDPLRYFAIRARESHDIWHVLADYDTSVKGELALQGLTLAQTSGPLPGLLLATGLLHVAKTEPARVDEYFAAMAEGYERGRKAQYWLAIAFEEHWSTPLADVRRIAGLV